MSSQAFFWLNISCGLILVILFFIGRRGFPAPSKLNLRRGGFGGAKGYYRSKSPESEFLETGAPPLKNLNVVFLYNGHTFDAFEVLGAPAGASVEMAEKYFNQALAKKSSNRVFLEAAFSAIKLDRRK